MALSGSSTSTISSGFGLKLVWSATQDKANNTSTITTNIYLSLTNARIGVGQRTDASITIDGVTSTRTFNAIPLDKTVQTKDVYLGSWSRTVSHSAEGKKSASLSAMYPIRATLNGTYYSTATVSATAALDDIPRASQPSVNYTTRALDNLLRVSTNRAVSAFTHRLKYQVGASAAITIANGVGDYYDWNLPDTIANYITTSTVGAVTITCETYNTTNPNDYSSTTLIGSKTVAFTASVPNIPKYQPNISAITTTPVNDLYDYYVQSKSKINAQASGTGNYNASISSTTITIDGTPYTTTNATSDTIYKSGNIVVSASVTDSRGYSKSTSKTVAFQTYAPPQITSFSASRYPTDKDTGIKVTYAYSISEIDGQNSKLVLIKYREVGATGWTEVWGDSTSYSGADTYTSASNHLDVNKSYEVQLYAADYYTATTQTKTVSTAFSLINFNQSKRGMAIGKVSESNSFEVALPAMFIGGITGISVNGKDMNTVTETGFYYGYNVANAGVPDISSFMVIKYSPDWITQIQFVQEATSRIFIRSRYNGTTWSTWRQI